MRKDYEIMPLTISILLVFLCMLFIALLLFIKVSKDNSKDKTKYELAKKCALEKGFTDYNICECNAQYGVVDTFICK